MRKIAATFFMSPMSEEARDLVDDEHACVATLLHPSEQPRPHCPLDLRWALRVDSAGVEWQMEVPESVARFWLQEIGGVR